MVSRRLKTVILHTLLLSYTLLPQCLSQTVPTVQANTFQNTYYPGYIPTNFATKGYGNTQLFPGTYTNYPVHSQYWTGNALYAQQPYQAYPAGYGNYVPYGNYYAQPYYTQPYAQYGQSYYGYNPGFDAQYWMGNLYKQQMPVYFHQMPVYHPGVPAYPMYYGQQVWYPHGYPQPMPYYGKPRGFFGGTGHELAKTLLGAVVVGTIAGAVARRG